MKAAIVTGVSRGLGESLAAALLARGFAVTGVGRTSAERLSGEHYRFVRCDFGKVEAIESALAPVFGEIAAARPRSICLINNAAVAGPVGVLGTLDAATIAESLAVNLVAPLALVNLFCRMFAEGAAQSLVINVSSGAAQSPLGGSGPYSIAKAGLEMLTRQIAAEQKAQAFRAISVRPGIIDTGMQAYMRTLTREKYPNVDMFREFHASGQLVPPDVVAAKIVDRLVLGDVENGRCYSYKEL
ncbi:MAG TPA: SDR family NAD(P)-dependent oxidoreductase [Casimicrobiaceae bacterium]|jgi:benzil reductase ((S)-benzoin forming)|nr:SDR family NAD(P)-dependent oxidoreductase [Casimicrobiaceae bacterium]